MNPIELREELWVTAEPWLADAKCVRDRKDPHFFFPPIGQSLKDVRAYCNGTPMQDPDTGVWFFQNRCPFTGRDGQCVEFNLRTTAKTDDVGVWGGTSVAERNRIRKERRTARGTGT